MEAEESARYKKELRKFLFDKYKETPMPSIINDKPLVFTKAGKTFSELPKYKLWDIRETVLDTKIFSNTDIEIIKEWLNDGAIAFSHFNRDYTKLIFYKNEFTEKIVAERIAERKAKKKV